MNGKDLLVGLGYIGERYFEEAETGTIAVPGRKRFRRPLMVAAIIALMLLLVGCVALVWSIRDLKIADMENDVTSFVNGAGNLVTVPDTPTSVLTIHGLQGSPVYQAHQEWYAFTESYDRDHTLASSYDNQPMEIPEAYEAYSVYTQEMMDKVDEIASKYNLKLLGAFAPFQRYESDVFYEALGIDSLLVDGSQATVDSSAVGKFYEGGNFDISFHMTMPGEDGNWPYEMLNEMYYSKTDYFDDTYMVIGDWNQWEQWNYTTKNGDELLVMWFKDGGGARLFCSREDALICVTVDARYQTDFNETTSEYDTTLYMTKEQLKQVADEIDFSICVDTVNMDLARERLEKFRNQRKAEAEKDPEGYTSYLQKDYAAFIETHLAGQGSERYIAEQYALMDIDGDGTEELLLGNNDRIFEIVYMVNGKAQMVHDGADESHADQYFYQYYEVCGEGCLISRLDGSLNGVTFFSVYTAEDYHGRKVEKPVEALMYAPEGEYPWSREVSGELFREPITEEEYKEIVEYWESRVIPVEMKPISEFPME